MTTSGIEPRRSRVRSIDMTGVSGVRSVSSPPLELVGGEPHDLRIEFAGTRPRVGLEPATLQLGWTHPDDAVAPQIREAADAAAAADVAVVFARTHEGEQRDRASLTLPNEQDLLIREVAEANPRTIVVLASGGPVLMPWLDQVPAVVQSYFGGQEQGNAIARVLFGDVNPAGRLPITYPRSEAEVPPGLENPWTTEADPDVEYEEDIFVGYRGFDEFGIEPLFPFGHGLSYTTFRYRGPGVSGISTANRDARISFSLHNTGDRAGAEVAQVYVGELPTEVPTPPRQLAGFARVELDPGQRQRVTIEVDRQSLSYWDEAANAWVTPRGRVPVYVGSSSRDLRLEGFIQVR